MNQEQIMQIQMMEQEATQLNEHLKMIEQNISEMQELNIGLEEIEKKESQEILANIGKRIYIPVEIKSKKLIVDIGNKTFIKKSISETKEIVKEQIKKLGVGKIEVMARIEEIQGTMEKLLEEIEKDPKK